MHTSPPASRRIEDRRVPHVSWILSTGLLGALLFGAVVLILGCKMEPAPTEVTEDEGPVATQLTLDVGSRVVIGLGIRVQLHATPRDSRGQPVPGYEMAWSSSDASIVFAEADGYLTANAVGTATLTVTANKPGKGQGGGNAGGGGKDGAPGQLKKQVDVEVDPEQVASVEVLPDPAQLMVGSHQQMTAVLRDKDGNQLFDRIVEWSSSDESVASVDDLGDVFGNSVGTTGVTALSEGVSDVAGVFVEMPAVVVDIAVWPVGVTIDAGQEAQFYAASLRSDGSVSCAPENPSTDPNVLFNATVVAGCDSAAGRLAALLAGEESGP